MKTLVLILLCLLSLPAIACDNPLCPCAATCKCDPCYCGQTRKLLEVTTKNGTAVVTGHPADLIRFYEDFQDEVWQGDRWRKVTAVIRERSSAVIEAKSGSLYFSTSGLGKRAIDVARVKYSRRLL